MQDEIKTAVVSVQQYLIFTKCFNGATIDHNFPNLDIHFSFSITKPNWKENSKPSARFSKISVGLLETEKTTKIYNVAFHCGKKKKTLHGLETVYVARRPHEAT